RRRRTQRPTFPIAKWVHYLFFSPMRERVEAYAEVPPPATPSPALGPGQREDRTVPRGTVPSFSVARRTAKQYRTVPNCTVPSFSVARRTATEDRSVPKGTVPSFLLRRQGRSHCVERHSAILLCKGRSYCTERHSIILPSPSSEKIALYREVQC